MSGLKHMLGIDKLEKAIKVIKDVGGVKAALKQRYLMDQTRVGSLVGQDKFGNKYFEDNSFFMPRNRWVVFPERVWLDYDASQVPPEWHRWLHHIGDETPTVKPPQNEKWVLDHRENASIYTKEKYIPYSTTRTKIQGWVPGKHSVRCLGRGWAGHPTCSLPLFPERRKQVPPQRHFLIYAENYSTVTSQRVPKSQGKRGGQLFFVYKMPSSAEVLAYELEHGESDLKCSGKGRSKSERVENKHSDQNTNNRMIRQMRDEEKSSISCLLKSCAHSADVAPVSSL
ncbi:unnamed protein product, partial [Mesorhabditis belari]|uniref:NADH dehydrogenase [ubiquinone] 1 alpha subcomplex subunit 12 n=1 Tax=Mesorhabditis belari TaxID=2138241 RepID=A0AAF3J9E0_9BILA